METGPTTATPRKEDERLFVDILAQDHSTPEATVVAEARTAEIPAVEMTTTRTEPVHETRVEETYVRNETPRGRKGIAVLTAVACLGAGLFIGSRAGGASDEDANAAPISEAALAAADKACPETWSVVHTNNENSRLVAEGLPKPNNNGEAREVAQTWRSLVIHDPELLAGTNNALFNSNLSPAELHTNNCFNSKGEAAAAQLDTYLASSQITAAEAPTTGINTGTDANGNVVRAANAGITGDRTAFKITDKDSKEVYVMTRCGNLVFVTPPSLPEGPTDQPDIPTTTSTPSLSAKPDPGRNVPGSLPNQPGSGGSREEDGTPDDNNNDGYESEPGNNSGRPKDSDGDGFPDASDSCPGAAENRNGYQDGDGCPDTDPKAEDGTTPTTGPRPTGDPEPAKEGEEEPDRGTSPGGSSSTTQPSPSPSSTTTTQPNSNQGDPDGDDVYGTNDKCPNQYGTGPNGC